MNFEPRFKIEVLSPEHKSDEFCSGVAALDKYIKQQASRDMSSKVSLTFVLIAEHSMQIRGFYTLSNLSITFSELPLRLQKRLPRYSHVGATLLGRLAIDSNYSAGLRRTTEQKPRLGEYLLFDAQQRSVRGASIISASVALVVDVLEPSESDLLAGAMDPMSFYLKYGFLPLPGNPRRVFKLTKVIENEMTQIP